MYMPHLKKSLTSTKFNRYAVLDVQVGVVSTIVKSLRDRVVN
jgi:hypothetical protein